uniref:Uncharacterized protein n=1 Tax=Chromera velia CCMP2878 TaxID=1169474 RepID=A0A0G4F1V1_9ALVE|eukprot:Cvel_2613.t1-p1 / transcript=Cvel_2613.t1 / gene=Cvel_2613 / organism=Chromera_velia_CCMP2878 / gene_product=hypothetical protein / transcript_product=hypothetical protein / location=Cvel_scaffold103:92863-96721(-) / protein_length=269 / sequence_SO=supercontig / SO=protein_coding / is_pseudo=false
MDVYVTVEDGYGYDRRESRFDHFHHRHSFWRRRRSSSFDFDGGGTFYHSPPRHRHYGWVLMPQILTPFHLPTCAQAHRGLAEPALQRFYAERKKANSIKRIGAVMMILGLLCFSQFNAAVWFPILMICAVLSFILAAVTHGWSNQQFAKAAMNLASDLSQVCDLVGQYPGYTPLNQYGPPANAGYGYQPPPAMQPPGGAPFQPTYAQQPVAGQQPYHQSTNPIPVAQPPYPQQHQYAPSVGHAQPMGGASVQSGPAAFNLQNAVVVGQP